MYGIEIPARVLGDYERAYNNLIKVLKKVNLIKK